eukprot:COSAG01_NODE_8443_length_2783_cov_3.987705_3_plen_117_part_00
MTATFLEIYNESIRDLLSDKPQAHAGRKEAWADDKGKKAEPHNIKHDEFGNTTVTNMTERPVGSLAQVEQLMAMAAKQRSVGVTAMNSQSSRSHSVFTLRLTGGETGTSTMCRECM